MYRLTEENGRDAVSQSAPPVGKPEVSIIIVSYNNARLLDQTLSSIIATVTAPTIEIIVVDNASTDTNVELVKQRFPFVRVLSNEKNVGFGAGCNIGAAASRGDVLLFVNSDIKLLTNPIPGMLRLLRMQDVTGVVGCQLLNPDGSLQPSYFRFPSIFLRVLQLSGMKGLLVRLAPALRFKSGDGFESDMVAGAFFAMPKDLFEHIGGFDEDYFMYVEDSDLCFRVHKIGRKVLVHDTKGIIHFGQHREDMDSSFLMYHYNRGLILFYGKHYGRLRYIGVILVSICAFASRYAIECFVARRGKKCENLRLTLRMYTGALLSRRNEQ